MKSTVPAARKRIAASDQSTKAPGRVLTPAKAAELLKMRARFTDQSNEVDTNYATPSRDYGMYLFIDLSVAFVVTSMVFQSLKGQPVPI